MREMLEGDRPVIIEMPRRDDGWILTGVIVPEIDRRRECAREISLGVAGGREEEVRFGVDDALPSDAADVLISEVSRRVTQRYRSTDGQGENVRARAMPQVHVQVDHA